MYKNNKGFSLIELIIVISIMAVLLISLIYSVSMIFSADAKGCADSLTNAIADTKINAMGRAGAYLELSRDEEGDIWVTQYIKKDEWMVYKEPKAIGDKNVYLSTSPADENLSDNLAGGKSYYISFDRSSGAFTEMVTDKEGQIRECITENLYIKGGNRSYQLLFYGLTGKTDIIKLN